MRYKTKTAFLGAFVEPNLLKQLDAFRGEVPRSRVVERAVNQYLSAANTTNEKNLQGSRIQTPMSQAEITTTTSTDNATLRADNVIGMTTTEGSYASRRGVDANGKKVHTSL